MIQHKFLRTLGGYRQVVAMLLLAAFTLEGCVKRTEFELASIPEGQIEIDLEWEQDATPTPLTFAFYHAEEGALLYKEFEGTTEGFKGMLPPGDYHVIAYDKSAQRVSYRNMDNYHRAEVYAQSVAEAVKAGEGQLISEPGMVYAVGVCVGMETLPITADKTLKAKAQPLDRTRKVMLNFEIKNGTAITTITGAIGGVSSSVLLCSCTSSNYSAQVPFHVDRATDNTFYTSVALFDFISSAVGDEQVNTMYVTLGEADGSTHELTLDLTDVIRDIIHNNDGVIPIEIPIEVVFDMTDIEHITAIVKPWDPSGEGGGDVIG